ncbi:ESPR-type extended signal peptide-containing protein [Variovorax sp. IB41]|uniref:ESPR-type extended signal peptide-containing protein n=1 Tax=Variovorax sp. IB41 TaxID=2779370 RepID=UPI0018E89723|nr:ESPR-type extended signal peptide-containing protein [Variovorax sp. IB41]MBJ2154938.1 YadA-like family protein [Variovorax sp. IB41]
MNRTYRSLWNESLGAWVAASEVSHARGKPGGSHVALGAAPSMCVARPRPAGGLLAGLAAALVAMSGLGWSSLAQAQAVDCSGPPYNAYNGTASCMGFQSRASGIGATALGSLAASDVLGGLAVGYNAHSAAQNSISLGFQAYSAAANSIYLGARTGPTTGALGGGSIGIGTDVTASGGNSIAAGSFALANQDNATAVGSTARATGLRSLAMGYKANASDLDAVAQGNSAAASAQNAIAVGFQSVASQLNSVYIGSRTAAGTGATGVGAIAIGTDVTASNGNATAVGFQSKATGASSVAVGPNAAASDTSAMALGTGTVASNTNAVALGATATATSAGASALGTLSKATGGNSTAVGVSSTASAARAFAGGWGSNAGNTDAVAVGTLSNASGISSAAFGNLANASADFAVALGNQALSSGVGAVAAGSGANAATDGAVAVGNNAAATLTRATALGFGTAAAGQNATAVGALASASADQAVAIGASAKASALNAIAMGNNTVANSADAVAIGNGSTATGGKAVAIGSGNVANGNGAVAIGDPNTATGNGAIANGLDNTATGDGSVAMGNTNKVGGGGQDVSVPGTPAQGAVGIGYQNTVVGQGSVAIGSTSKALAAGAVAFGDTAVATNKNDVALGSGSVTATAVGTPSATINGKLYNFQGIAPTSTVSVGAGGGERTVTNVAAGRISGTSTDAINGSQLAATNSAVDDVAATANKGWNLSANGGAPQNIAPGGTADFADGSNTTVTRTGNQIRVDVSANPVFTSVTTGNTKIDNNGLTIVGGPSVTNTGINAGGTKITNVAPGVAGTDAVNIDQLTTTVAGSKTKYYQVNSKGGGNELNDGATGTDAIASGKNATAAGTSSVAMGLGATAGTANSVALGAGSVTDTAVGTASTTINGTVHNFQGAVPVGTVSIGSAGNERTITNVAAGRISGTSTDAINGSQLFATNSAITDVAGTVAKGWNLSANGGAPQNIAPGGTADFANGSNTTVTRTGNQIRVDVSADPVFNSVTTGNTKIDNNGLTIVGGPSVTNTGINAGGTQITNVAPGVAGTDAVNINQLNTTVAGSKTKYYQVNSVGGGNELNDGATGTDAIASGKNATAAGTSSVAMGLGATAGTANSVALGAGSVTDTAVGTASTTIDGKVYNFQGVAPVGTVSVGTAGNERTITNVAAGRISGTSTDAINGSQLFATNQSIENLSSTVTANKNRYYSVNSKGGGNEDNLGATGADAIASGKDASATVDGGVAIGAGAVSDRAIAGSTGNIPAGSALIPFNTTDRTLLGALSVGSATTYRQITNVADGTQAQDAVTVRQLSGALQSFAVTPIKYFHANSAAADSLAVGAESVAVGPQTVVNGNNGVGIGNGAVVQQSAPGGIAIGQGATSHLADSIAMGTGASAAGVQGVALGAGSSVTQAGGVALGAGAVASTAAGVAGYVPPTATDAQRIAIGATTSTLAAVSVGNAASGQFRQITGVAAGTADSDAVNVSQLRGVQGTVAAIDQSTVKYDSNADGSVNYNSVSMGGSNATGPVTVHNVAPGVAGTDAVNVNQLNALGGGLNNRINAVNDRIDGVEKNAYAGVAAAMALQMPGSYVPGKTVMRIGAGSFKGESAVGVSFRRTAENNAWSITGGVATSRAGVGATVGAEWVFN